MKIERPRLGGGCFCPSYVVVVRRGDRFFPGTVFQDRHRRPQAAGEPEKPECDFIFIVDLPKRMICNCHVTIHINHIIIRLESVLQ